VEDRAAVQAQIGRPPRAFRRVVVRCPLGRPAVSEQNPYDEQGRPFPTGYYLTCPELVAAVARLEASGAVERWNAALRDDERLRTSLEQASAEQRRLRKELAGDEKRVEVDRGTSLELGIGGAASTGRLKCLHAHVAFALARPGYELGERILAELKPLWPDRCPTVRRCGA
jgi:hypothetical protein